MTENKVVLERVLDTPMGKNDAGAGTIREYLGKLLLKVWNEGEGFSGKRPFGNSCWELEIYSALVKSGHVTGGLDDDGYLEDFDEITADHLIAAAIRHLCELAEEAP